MMVVAKICGDRDLHATGLTHDEARGALIKKITGLIVIMSLENHLQEEHRRTLEQERITTDCVNPSEIDYLTPWDR